MKENELRGSLVARAHVCTWRGAWRAQDNISAFWEIGKREAEDRRAELRNKDRELEELEERHQVEIKARAPGPRGLSPCVAVRQACRLGRWRSSSSFHLESAGPGLHVL